MTRDEKIALGVGFGIVVLALVGADTRRSIMRAIVAAIDPVPKALPMIAPDMEPEEIEIDVSDLTVH